MILTIHYLTENFFMRSFTLEVQPIKTTCTSEMIKSKMDSSFSSWDLDVTRLSMMLRESSNHMMKACDDWCITHFPNTSHSLHLVVGLLLLISKDNGVDELNDDVNFDDGLCDSFDVRQIVQDLRKFCDFVMNSSYRIAKVEDLKK